MRESQTIPQALRFFAAAIVYLIPMSVLGTVPTPGAIFTDKFSHLQPSTVVFLGSVSSVSPGEFRKELGKLADYSVGKIIVLRKLRGDPKDVESVYFKETFYQSGGCWERRTRHSTWVLPGDVVLVVASERLGVAADGSPATFLWAHSVSFLPSQSFDRNSTILEQNAVSYDEFESISCDSLTTFSELLKTVHPIRSETGYNLSDIDKALLEIE